MHMRTELKNKKQYFIGSAQIMLVASILLIFMQCNQCKEVDSDLSIEWETRIGEVPVELWGVNDYEVTDLISVKDSLYKARMQAIKPSLVRVHFAYIADEFTDSIARTWDEELIVDCFKHAAEAFGDAKIMLNPIAKWPEWLCDKNLVLNQQQENELVQLFVDFLKIIKRNNIRVDYWEILNERENLYYKAGKLPQLWSLFNRIVREFRKIEADIVIGGPGLTYPKEPHFSMFLDSCIHNIDFVSWHNYASPNPTTSNTFILNNAVSTIDSFANYVIEQAKLRNAKHEMQYFLTELNIQWTWSPIEERHANHIGALYMALVVEELAKYPINGVAMWHFKGNSYGIIDKDNHMRTPAYLYQWGNEFIWGDRFQSSLSSNVVENDLKIMAVKNSSGKSVLVINRSKANQYQINLNAIGFNSNALVQLIDEQNQTPLTITGHVITVPKHALLFISEALK